VVLHLRTAPTRAIAEALEALPNSQWDLPYFDRIDRALTEDIWCVWEAVQSNVTIRLATLDAAYRSGNVEQRSAALAKAHETVRKGLLCFPRDGNLWLRLAMLEHERTGATTGVAEMLQASFAAAPHEAWIVLPRVSFSSRLQEAALPQVDNVLRADVATIVAGGRTEDLVSLYVGADEELRKRIGAALNELDDIPRRNSIESAITLRLRQSSPR
jgi:hypothetical protein